MGKKKPPLKQVLKLESTPPLKAGEMAIVVKISTFDDERFTFEVLGKNIAPVAKARGYVFHDLNLVKLAGETVETLRPLFSRWNIAEICPPFMAVDNTNETE